ncbi:MAG TPA: hypothetical protein VNZ94_00315 [Xanthobacteraceae bacterium]|nr:hypothetical protein [Xanthobacteraceae bacterium]
MFDRCARYWQEMLDWLAMGQRDRRPIYDGTVGSLIRCYETDRESPFHENRFSTQQLYRDWGKALTRLAGKRRVSALVGADIRGWYRELRKPEKPDGQPRERRASGAMEVFRVHVGYGAELGLPDCVALAPILNMMKFRKDRSESVAASPRAKKVAMTYEHAEAIVKKGLELGTRRARAVALGVAAQFEFTLRQIDVIGYWLPANRIAVEPGMMIFGKKAWRPGLRFEDFATGVLDLSTTKNDTDAVFDVVEYPLFQLALAAVPEEERRGPLVSPVAGEPVRRRFYSEIYREVADAAGVPATVWNARARHGGVTEGKDAGADIVDVSKHAQHSDISTTVRHYVVPSIETSRRVAKARVAKRNRDRET